MAKFKTRYQLEEQENLKGWKSQGKNHVLVERSGYVPLSVRLKQFTLAGIQLQLQAKQFDFNDYKELYHDMDVISPYDDLEETQNKLNRYYSALAQIQKKSLQKKVENVPVKNNNEQAQAPVSSDSNTEQV